MPSNSTAPASLPPRFSPTPDRTAVVPALALDAFDCGTALVDLTHSSLRWCSPGFEANCCVSVGDSIAALEIHLPGAQEALAKLASTRGDALRWNDMQPQRPKRVRASTDADAPRLVQWRSRAGGMEAQATLVGPGVAALRLLGDGSDAAQRERAARRYLEDRERLLFTSRALSVGEMASTLAHELNQPIGTVANVLRGIQTRIEQPDPAAASPQALMPGVQLALDQALFAARIVTRIREYTHSRQPRRERLDLAKVLRGSLMLLDWELQRDEVDVELDMSDRPCAVIGDEVMLEQLFVNLLRNALEAMRDNPPDERGRAERRLTLRLAPDPAGRDAVLALRDNGCGLPKGANQRIFVPFQSTKPNGMGIGLNICRSFVELHQGRLWFAPNDAEPASSPNATPARGCTFYVALPIAAATFTPSTP
jgi:signal transduction histidine kinase